MQENEINEKHTSFESIYYYIKEDVDKFSFLCQNKSNGGGFLTNIVIMASTLNTINQSHQRHYQRKAKISVLNSNFRTIVFYGPGMWVTYQATLGLGHREIKYKSNEKWSNAVEIGFELEFSNSIIKRRSTKKLQKKKSNTQ